MKRSLLLLLLVGAAATTKAQPGFENLDINPGLGSASPMYISAFGKKVYCYANDGTSGRELFWADSATKPKLTDNLNTGSGHAISVGYGKPTIGVNGKFYFTATNGASGEELFSYDGTNSPTLVWDIDMGTGSSAPDNYTENNGTLYFRATTPTHGYELWQYDITNKLAKRLTDIRSGVDSSLTGDVLYYKSNILFTADDGTNGNELWSYNILTQQAQLVSDIDTGMASSDPKNLTIIDGKVYFSANEQHTGRELYEYDGTGNPQRVTDIDTSFTSGVYLAPGVGFIKFNNLIYFAGRYNNQVHLYSYNPTTKVAKLEQKINPNGNSFPQHFAVYKGRLFFAADDGANGLELWAYDGTNPPSLMADLCPGASGSMPAGLVAIGNDLFFSATDCKSSGAELFRYNAELAGIRNTLFDGSATFYPNPIPRNLKIELNLVRDEELRIRIADINGQTIYDTDVVPYPSGKSKIDVPMKNLPAGGYIYYIQNKDSTTYLTGKLIKL